MKTLTLSNGVSYEFTDDSHITHLETTVSSFKVLDEMAANITEENLSGADFDGELITDMVPQNCQSDTNMDGNIHVIFVTRKKTEMELMYDQITELQEAVAELASMGV